MSTFAVETQPSVKDRLIGLLNALEYGLYPPDGCGGCVSAVTDKCGEHSRDAANQAVAGRAVHAVEDAGSDAEAEAAFLAAIAVMSEIRLVVASGVLAGGAR